MKSHAFYPKNSSSKNSSAKGLSSGSQQHLILTLQSFLTRFALDVCSSSNFRAAAGSPEPLRVQRRWASPYQRLFRKGARTKIGCPPGCLALGGALHCIAALPHPCGYRCRFVDHDASASNPRCGYNDRHFALDRADSPEILGSWHACLASASCGSGRVFTVSGQR